MTDHLTCQYCHAPAKLVDSTVIYGRSYGPAWVCSNYPACDAYCGCHRGTTRPLGTLANAELRKARSGTHAMFDPMWRASRKKHARDDAYRWLAKVMDLDKEACHVGSFTLEQCERAQAAIRERLKASNRKGEA